MDNSQKKNADTPWDTLGEKFWESYSEKNYAKPIPADLEGIFSVVNSMRHKTGGTFLDIGTGSAPQYALAAVLAGMDDITVSDHAKGAVEWLNKELLDDMPLSQRSQMWVDITKLLSTFKDRNELAAYCKETGFDKRAHLWEELPGKEKQEWFDDRRSALAENGVKEHFLDADYDIKNKVKEMSDNGHFQIRQFSIFSPPPDLIGKADVVCGMYVAEKITGVPSENCEILMQTCNLARPKTGIVNLGNISAGWSPYEGNSMILPSLPRPYSYTAATSGLLFDDDYHSNYKDNFHKEKKAVRTATTSSMLQPTTISMPFDNRFDYLTLTSGIPKEHPYTTGTEMLADAQIHVLEIAKDLLIHDSSRRNITSDNHLKNLSNIEKSLGIEASPITSIAKNSPAMKRQIMADRIDTIVAHMKSPEHARDVDTMNKHDELLNDFLSGLHKDLVGRKDAMHMVM